MRRILHPLFMLLHILFYIQSYAYRPLGNRNLMTKIRRQQRSQLEFMLSEAESVNVPDFVPPEVGPEIYIGTVVSILPIIWATYEFNKRIQTQRNCLLCQGSGLVKVTKAGNPLTRPRKCWSCGGFLPWLGWKMFFFSTFYDVGNGGVLQRPARNYEEIQENIRSGMFNREGIKREGEESVVEDIDNDDSNKTLLE